MTTTAPRAIAHWFPHVTCFDACPGVSRRHEKVGTEIGTSLRDLEVVSSSLEVIRDPAGHPDKTTWPTSEGPIGAATSSSPTQSRCYRRPSCMPAAGSVDPHQVAPVTLGPTRAPEAPAPSPAAPASRHEYRSAHIRSVGRKLARSDRPA